MTQAPEAPARTRAQISQYAFRTDPWPKQPGIGAAGLSILVTYATAHVFSGPGYYMQPNHYLTPFYAKYTGETKIPVIAQNLHRYLWYMAMLRRDPEHLSGIGVLDRHHCIGSPTGIGSCVTTQKAGQFRQK
jgi:hypothetical protein